MLSRVTLKFDGWPWKTIGLLFYATSSFVPHFVAIVEFKLELQSGNAQSGYLSTCTNFKRSVSINGVSPMFPSPYVPRFMILVPMFPMFPSPYVTQKCSPVLLFPKLTLPSPCVPQYPCFPYSQSLCFPVPIVPQSLCSPVPLFPSPYRCSPVPMFPSAYVLQTCSPVCMFPQLIHQSLCSPVLFMSTEVFSIPYVP